MIPKAFLKALDKKSIYYSLNEPMDQHTTFRIGGKAEAFIKVSSIIQLKTVIKTASEFSVPTVCIGNGSNILISDNGIDGAVIKLSGMNRITISDNYIVSEAGISLPALCKAACDAGLSGLEALSGIPGSVGGAIYMNAGAYQNNISDVIIEAVTVDPSGDTRVLSAAELCFGYRTSILQQTGAIVASAKFKLEKSTSDAVNKKSEQYMAQRRSKQPLNYPNAGSTFKRPSGYYAGELIEKNGLKGAHIGGAQVSKKHAGFIINTGGATAADVKKLIKKIQDTVSEADGVLLEPEIIFIGKEES